MGSRLVRRFLLEDFFFALVVFGGEDARVEDDPAEEDALP
jgi:hypothetical protein